MSLGLGAEGGGKVQVCGLGSWVGGGKPFRAQSGQTLLAG